MSSTVARVSTPGSLRYLQQIGQFQMLSAQDEFDLARRWRDRQDEAALNKIITSHLRLVARTAANFRGYGMSISELIGEGNVGLTQAAKRFDPDRGFRFSTYAVWWIRAAIHEYILHNWSSVRMGTTSAQKKLFFNLRRIKGRMQAIEEGDLEPEKVAEIARMLGVPEQDVISMNRRLAAQDRSLNAPVGRETQEEWQDFLVDETESHEDTIAYHDELTRRKAWLPGALLTLDDRERYILVEHRMRDDARTLEELAEHYGISRERVRQIETRALRKLRDAMNRAEACSALMRMSSARNCWIAQTDA